MFDDDHGLRRVCFFVNFKSFASILRKGSPHGMCHVTHTHLHTLTHTFTHMCEMGTYSVWNTSLGLHRWVHKHLHND